LVSATKRNQVQFGQIERENAAAQQEIDRYAGY